LRLLIILFSIFLAFIIFLSGCAPYLEFTKTGPGTNYDSMSKDCDIKVYTTPPRKDFEEIGALEFFECSINDVKRLTAKEVCFNGGNGLLLGLPGTGIHREGCYVNATIIRVDE
jgi:hypothetical protein